MKFHLPQANDQEARLFTCPARSPTQPNSKRKSWFALAIRWTTLLGRTAFIARRCASSTRNNPTSSIINRRRFASLASYHSQPQQYKREREKNREWEHSQERKREKETLY
jgi:hypothetical protein